MKNVLIVLGFVFIVLIFAGASFIGYIAYFGNKFDASSKAYIDEGIPAIVSSWSEEEFIKRASSQLREKTSNGQLHELFTTLSSKLGAFRSYNGAKGDSNMGYTTQNGEVVTASYVAETTFQNGKAEIQIKLIRVKDAWQILGFHVEMKPL
jgi:hypothetical protein